MVTTKQKNKIPLNMSDVVKFYRVELEPKSNFMHFRIHSIGKKELLGKVLGQRGSGVWDTQAWLISKDIAHKKDHTLVIDDQKIRATLKPRLRSITHIIGDTFKAHVKK